MQVTVLVGRDRMPYKRIANHLGIKTETVRTYATVIRDKLGSSLPPRDALTEYFWTHRGEFGQVAEWP